MRVLTFLFLLISSISYGQTHTWATGAAEYNKPTIKVQEFGNDVKVYIDVPNYPNRYATFIKKSFFPGFKIVKDTVYVPKICPTCPVCPPPVDVKTTKEYKDVLALLAQKIDLITAKDNQLNQLNNQFNQLQALQEQSARDNLMLSNEMKRIRKEEAKYIIVPFKIPRAMLDSLKRP